MLLAALVAIVAVFLPLTPAYDLDVFLRAGRAIINGFRVYPRPNSPAVYSGFSFVYPYFAVWPFVPLAALPVALAKATFFAISACAVVAAALRGSDGDPWRAVLVLCTSFTITGLQLGALSPLLFAGAVFLWRLRERPLGLGLLAALVVGSKLFLAPLLMWPLVAGRRRAFAAAGAFTLVLLGAGFVVGPLGPMSYRHLLSQLGAHEARAGFGLIGALMNAGLTAGAAEGAAVAVAAVSAAAVYLHWRRARDERILFCGAVAVSLVLSPVVWSHYFVLIPAGLLVLNASRRWFVAVALASWAIAPPHGVNLHTELLGVNSAGTWLTVLGSLAIIDVSIRLTRRRLER
jgi:alpha-1,2-mannosyltransferase